MMQGTAGVIQGTRRITAIVDGLAKHLGLKMALKKCFTGPIIKLNASMVGATTKKDVEEMGWKFVCEDVRCGAHFRTCFRTVHSKNKLYSCTAVPI